MEPAIERELAAIFSIRIGHEKIPVLRMITTVNHPSVRAKS